MSARTPTATARPRRAPARRSSAVRHRRRTAVRRRRLALGALLVLAAGAALVLLQPFADKAVRELALPLRHDDVIRQQAADKNLDPALIAAVIYAESRFRNGQTSSAGALGLMQVTPATARDIARRSGGTRFVIGDLADPQVNISYGAYHLRYLLDRYGGNEAFAIAAYNAGEGNVDRWIAAARADGRALTPDAIPFPETRHYVDRVLAARQQYRDSYAGELGLD
ncbi:MAG TPA: lytic transglycosylase domain-containing protein [Solirubrobacteraceae bacterium]|nr:lytic transglycosylase domain-containing protein [Solirubrobacteraceae bacterium]